MDKIVVKGLQKSFGSKHILRGIDLSVKEGESLVIIGGSGTGKSVTLKCMLDLIRPDKGQILMDGEDMIASSGRDRLEVMMRFGMLFQGGALFDSLPVWQNISFSLINNRGYPPSKAKELAAEKLQAVGLKEDTLYKYPAELSGGMQKRVGLARAIAGDPDIIFFDEPTAGLDPIMCTVIDTLIMESVKKLGATTITITHDLRTVHRIADKVALLHDGRIVWTGTKEQMEHTKDPALRQFLTGALEGPLTRHG